MPGDYPVAPLWRNDRNVFAAMAQDRFSALPTWSKVKDR
jgi:hypothetical protein